MKRTLILFSVLVCLRLQAQPPGVSSDIALAITAGAVEGQVSIRFNVPGPGTYYLLSRTSPGACMVESANHSRGACHVAWKGIVDAQNKAFWVWFVPDR